MPVPEEEARQLIESARTSIGPWVEFFDDSGVKYRYNLSTQEINY